jgi:hypothetical protein
MFLIALVQNVLHCSKRVLFVPSEENHGPYNFCANRTPRSSGRFENGIGLLLWALRHETMNGKV